MDRGYLPERCGHDHCFRARVLHKREEHGAVRGSILRGRGWGSGGEVCDGEGEADVGDDVCGVVGQRGEFHRVLTCVRVFHEIFVNSLDNTKSIIGKRNFRPSPMSDA